MKCAWNELLGILPPGMRKVTDTYKDICLQEVRLRIGQPPLLIAAKGNAVIPGKCTREDLQFVINSASRYSPWAAATTAKGYLTAPGGHRIGVCGECVVKQGVVTGFRNVTSLCIRIAREFEGISSKISLSVGSTLIIGPPGSGKTTLLRDLIRRAGNRDDGSIAVVDERGELFPVGSLFSAGNNTDVLTGCDKPQGLLMALKTMGPRWIAVDEITAQADCEALQEAAWCGVSLLATVHALDKRDLMSRKLFAPLVTAGVFRQFITLRGDKSFQTETNV